MRRPRAASAARSSCSPPRQPASPPPGFFPGFPGGRGLGLGFRGGGLLLLLGHGHRRGGGAAGAWRHPPPLPTGGELTCPDPSSQGLEWKFALRDRQGAAQGRGGRVGGGNGVVYKGDSALCLKSAESGRTTTTRAPVRSRGPSREEALRLGEQAAAGVVVGAERGVGRRVAGGAALERGPLAGDAAAAGLRAEAAVDDPALVALLPLGEFRAGAIGDLGGVQLRAVADGERRGGLGLGLGPLLLVGGLPRRGELDQVPKIRAGVVRRGAEPRRAGAVVLGFGGSG